MSKFITANEESWKKQSWINDFANTPKLAKSLTEEYANDVIEAMAEDYHPTLTAAIESLAKRTGLSTKEAKDVRKTVLAMYKGELHHDDVPGVLEVNVPGAGMAKAGDSEKCSKCDVDMLSEDTDGVATLKCPSCGATVIKKEDEKPHHPSVMVVKTEEIIPDHAESESSLGDILSLAKIEILKNVKAGNVLPMKRKYATNKEAALYIKKVQAWFQGANEPTQEGSITSNNPETLGYPKEMGYDKTPMSVPVGGDSRGWEQNWFESSAADTKKVMGPSGHELKEKENLQRAKQVDKFQKEALKKKDYSSVKKLSKFYPYSVKKSYQLPEGQEYEHRKVTWTDWPKFKQTLLRIGYDAAARSAVDALSARAAGKPWGAALQFAKPYIGVGAQWLGTHMFTDDPMNARQTGFALAGTAANQLFNYATDPQRKFNKDIAKQKKQLQEDPDVSAETKDLARKVQTYKAPKSPEVGPMGERVKPEIDRLREQLAAAPGGEEYLRRLQEVQGAELAGPPPRVAPLTERLSDKASKGLDWVPLGKGVKTLATPFQFAQTLQNWPGLLLGHLPTHEGIVAPERPITDPKSPEAAIRGLYNTRGKPAPIPGRDFDPTEGEQ